MNRTEKTYELKRDYNMEVIHKGTIKNVLGEYYKRISDIPVSIWETEKEFDQDNTVLSIKSKRLDIRDIISNDTDAYIENQMQDIDLDKSKIRFTSPSKRTNWLNWADFEAWLIRKNGDG